MLLQRNTFATATTAQRDLALVDKAMSAADPKLEALAALWARQTGRAIHIERPRPQA